MQRATTPASLREGALAFAPVVLMLVIVAWSVVLFRRGAEGRAWVRHTETVLATIASAQGHLQDAETGQRGYLLTGNTAYLEPYRFGRDSIGPEIGRLRRLTADNARQQRVLDLLEPLIDRRVARIDSTVAVRQSGDAAGALELVRTGYGKVLMDSARALIADMRSEERRLLEQRNVREERDQGFLRLALTLGLLLSALISYLVNSRFARHAVLQTALAHELAQRNNALQEQQVEIELTNQQLQEQQLELEISADQMREHSDELARTTAELREANATKRMFLANMSHELRTPLNAIAGHVQLIEMGLHGPVNEAQLSALDRISRAQRHLLALINDILNFAKLDAGRIAYHVAPTDVRDVLRDVTGMVETQMATAGLSFSAFPAGDIPSVWADPEKLRQILINLFSNATKFTPAGGRVSFEVVADPQDDAVVELRVSDTGIGIPREKLEQIFDPFVQLGVNTTASHQGSGLGLAISRDLARGMGGELTVQSDEGAGSTFSVRLRRARAAAEGQTGSPFPQYSSL